MNSNQLDPQKALNPAYKKFTPLKKDVDDFAKELEKCISVEKTVKLTTQIRSKLTT